MKHRGESYVTHAGKVLLLLVLGGLLAPLWQARWSPADGPAATEADTPVLPPPPVTTAETNLMARTDLLDHEKSTIAIFERYAPSTVTVVNRALFRDFWGSRVFEDTRGTGSGIVWDRKGHIVSNFHVVEGASAIEVMLMDGSAHPASVVGVDPDHDLAVLKIDVPAERLAAVTVGTSSNVKVGQTVLAIGNPFGFEHSLSRGVVSSLGREMRTPTGLVIQGILQTDAAINSGNSGGPLLDSAGRLIGINTFIVSPSGGSVGIGFAIPVDTVGRVVADLIQFGRVRRAGLGISLVPDHIARYNRIRGAVLREVVADGAADKAGLRGMRGNRIGDIVIGINDTDIDSAADLRNALDPYKEGQTVRIRFRRDAEELTTEATLQMLE